RLGPGHPEVGRQRQLQTTTEGITRDRRHDRLGYACHGRDRILQVACVLTHLHSGAIDHLLDVGARHEHLLPAVEDYGTHGGVLGDLPNRSGDLCRHRRVERVHLGPVQPDHGHRRVIGVGLHSYELSHGPPLSRSMSLASVCRTYLRTGREADPDLFEAPTQGSTETWSTHPGAGPQGVAP